MLHDLNQETQVGTNRPSNRLPTNQPPTNHLCCVTLCDTRSEMVDAELETRKVNELLQRMLPQRMLKRLQQGQQLVADAHKAVTILMTGEQSVISGFEEGAVGSNAHFSHGEGDCLKEWVGGRGQGACYRRSGNGTSTLQMIDSRRHTRGCCSKWNVAHSLGWHSVGVFSWGHGLSHED